MAFNDTSFVNKMRLYEKAKAGVIPEVSRVALKFFRERFRRSAWYDDRNKPWQKTADMTGEKVKRKRGILIKSGALLRSIRVTQARANILTIATDRPYAKIHNEGGSIRKKVSIRRHTRRRVVKKKVTIMGDDGKKKRKTQNSEMFSEVSEHSRQMNLTIPERRFIGNSTFLNRYISIAIYAHFKRYLT
jgi:phage gpG-like protein